ncbi:hypothetical protein L1987_54286 [Smallanthus sonchifolius]|uniref:Uncharacterized protein n=1 Tax=Smallanthus sonchifolius TaxID=185202 RepID=A0ACB9E6Q5_9ASTR|nr:hypothetical protein L1987_54286 [Smallanthus sonchifolius]
MLSLSSWSVDGPAVVTASSTSTLSILPEWTFKVEELGLGVSKARPISTSLIVVVGEGTSLWSGSSTLKFKEERNGSKGCSMDPGSDHNPNRETSEGVSLAMWLSLMIFSLECCDSE